MKVTLAKTSELILDPDNAREHSERNISAIKRSLQRFGIRKPIVAKEDTKVVYAGNATLAAALQLGIEEIPVAWIPSGTSETVCRAYAIADNRTAELADWDVERLDTLISELEGIELTDIGFDEAELETLLGDTEFGVDEAMGKEFDESIALDVEVIECPECGHQFAK